MRDLKKKLQMAAEVAVMLMIVDIIVNPRRGGSKKAEQRRLSLFEKEGESE